MLPVDFAPLAERLKSLRKLHDKLAFHKNVHQKLSNNNLAVFE